VILDARNKSLPVLIIPVPKDEMGNQKIMSLVGWDQQHGATNAK